MQKQYLSSCESSPLLSFSLSFFSVPSSGLETSSPVSGAALSVVSSTDGSLEASSELSSFFAVDVESSPPDASSPRSFASGAEALAVSEDSAGGVVSSGDSTYSK